MNKYNSTTECCRALCEANNIPESSVGLRWKQKKLDDYVVERNVGPKCCLLHTII